jgi:DegV family protein with EDD domain
VAVVTDSAADLPDELALRLNIHVVPVRVSFGEQDYLDKIGLSTAEFYRKLRTEIVLPRTSQPPPGDFRRQFEFLLSHHPAVVYVGLSRAVSGTLQAAETAAQRSHPERTRVFDSANAAGGQALLTIKAAEMAADGASAEAILAELERLRPQTVTWAIARDIGHAVRGGRVPRWAKPLLNTLGLVPIAKVTPEGKLGMAGAFLGGRAIPERFARYIAARVDRSRRWRAIVGHCDALADGDALLLALQSRLDCPEAWLAETGPAVGAHAGPGALVVSLQPV